MKRGVGGASGFTLFELLIVMFIIGLMSAFVVPRMVGVLENLRLRTAAQKTAAAMRRAQAMAAAEKRLVAVVFDFESRTLSVMTDSDIGRRKRAVAVVSGGKEASEDDSRTYRYPEGVRIERIVTPSGEKRSGSSRVLFYPMGNTSGAEIMLSGKRDRTNRITVDMITGAVKILE